MLRIAIATLLGVSLFLIPSVQAQTAEQVRNALARFLGAVVCKDPKLIALCGELGVMAAAWVQNGVSIAVDRLFDPEDQRLADEHGITICYRDGRCIHPRAPRYGAIAVAESDTKVFAISALDKAS